MDATFLICAILAFLVYVNTLGAGFVYDDRFVLFPKFGLFKKNFTTFNGTQSAPSSGKVANLPRQCNAIKGRDDCVTHPFPLG